MLNIAINNPKIEEFVQNEFHGNTDSFVRNMYDYMQFYKIKKETLEAKREIDMGNYLAEDEVFDSILKKYE